MRYVRWGLTAALVWGVGWSESWRQCIMVWMILQAVFNEMSGSIFHNIIEIFRLQDACARADARAQQQSRPCKPGAPL
jgi:hypothetical protein